MKIEVHLIMIHSFSSIAENEPADQFEAKNALVVDRGCAVVERDWTQRRTTYSEELYHAHSALAGGRSYISR